MTARPASRNIGQKCARHPGRVAVGGAPGGLLLCATCRHELRAALAALPEIYADCEEDLLPRRAVPGRRVGGSRVATGISLDEAAVATRSRILTLLSSWAALVTDERQIGRPPRRHPRYLAHFLDAHLDWLLCHPAGAEFAQEIAESVERARRSGRVEPAVRMDLGACPHPGCTATLTAAPAAGDGRGPHLEVNCAGGHSWPPHQWLAMYQRMNEAS